MAGEAPIAVDASDPTAIVRGIRLLEDPHEWDARSQAGSRVAHAFTWAGTAAALADVAKTLIRDDVRSDCSAELVEILPPESAETTALRGQT